MRAVRQHEFGPAGNLLFEEVPDPSPAAGQVRIAVRASGVHLADTAIRAGVAIGPFQRAELPMTPGREVAGVVDGLGEGTDPAWLGRPVVAHLGMVSGGYAELAVADATALHTLPDRLDHAVAVAIVGTGRITMGILDIAMPTPEDVVLVTAAAGGIGTLLVQAARNAGATVVGVAGGAAKTERVRASGATIAVDYTAPGWADAVRKALGGREVTLALDGVGGEPGRAALDLLGAGGRLVLFGWSAGEPTRFTSADLFERSLSVSVALGPRILRIPGGLRGLEERSLAEAAAGRLVPAVQAFPLKDAAAAHTALETRATIGKVVLVP
ncbi:zinc-binding dehydrogenase [Actinomadura sp. HBU206391]|uniref:zinc-binding dehydrogenase n=1 Tax=Actinomadura sp. HBU206391 TaxID=2731692 RepID=UPI0016508164|nr:zinc-binding dehydrogenase [Actinomadura sp. HBU206391]MBC6459840.1 zinc-binding dehydrogenase [Actinomadura sp. HBU206391]